MEIACRAFIFYQGKILLCKQKNPLRDFWTIPGGSVKVGETLIDCIKRELFEETGMAFEIEHLLFIRELIVSSRHRIEFYFSVKEAKDREFLDKIKPYNEIEELHFYEIKDLELITFKPDCLLNLVREIKEKSSVFPRYLGNVK